MLSEVLALEPEDSGAAPAPCVFAKPGLEAAVRHEFGGGPAILYRDLGQQKSTLPPGLYNETMTTDHDGVERRQWFQWREERNFDCQNAEFLDIDGIEAGVFRCGLDGKIANRFCDGRERLDITDASAQVAVETKSHECAATFR